MEANWKFLILSLAIAVVGFALIAGGAQYDDWWLVAAGSLSVVGAAVTAGISLRGLAGIGPAPGHGTAKSRHKLKFFWTPSAEPAPRATDEKIAQAERKLGLRLPQTYVRLLKQQDGGEPRYTLWAPPAAPDHACQYFQIDQFHGTAAMIGITEEAVRDGCLPKGVACVCGEAADDWQLCFDGRDAKADAEPAVVAFDLEGECFRLAAGFDELLTSLTRPVRAYVYAPQGALGKAADGLVADLDKALGLDLRPTAGDPDTYAADHPQWQSPSGRPARFELKVNALEGQPPGSKRTPIFPETWSYRVLHCDLAPGHREALEQSLRHCGHKWVLVNEPVQRLLNAGPYPG